MGVGGEIVVEDFVANFIGFVVEFPVGPAYRVGCLGGVHSAFGVRLVYAGVGSLEDMGKFGVGVSGMAAKDFLEALVVDSDLDATFVVGPIGVVDSFPVFLGLR